MLAAPSQGPYDLRFRLLDVPVRVSPWFWIIMLMLGGQADKNLSTAVVWVFCGFVSILVHEFGHALSSRALGREPIEVVLYGMGGLCYYPAEGQRPMNRFLVSAAGPCAGFVLAALVLVAVRIAYGVEPLDGLALVGIGNGDRNSALIRLPHAMTPMLTVIFLLYINIWWGLLNLLPVYPLDGGQMARVVIGEINPREGARWTHVLSLLTAGALAIWAASRRDWWMALWFGYFGFYNYQELERIHRGFGSGDSHRWR